MKKEELKKILKPLIKDCIREVIFEEGALSTIISEVVKGTSTNQVVYETKQKPRFETDTEANSRRQELLKENKKKLLNSIGRDAYNGVNVFEGTTPMSNRGPGGMSPQGSKALDGVAPSDSGVDISAFGLTTNVWKKLAGN